MDNSQIKRKAKEYVSLFTYEKFKGLIPVSEYVDPDEWFATNVSPSDMEEVKELAGKLLTKRFRKYLDDDERTPDAGTHSDDDKSPGEDSREDPQIDIDLVKEALRPLLKKLDPGDAAIVFWHRYFGMSPDKIVKIIASLPQGRTAIYNRIEKAYGQLRDPDYLLKNKRRLKR